ncbi:hypothetical protein RRG08_060953 [Elysia crispata]|uniref:Uncharacterized protein n=1 Tax=Elysia crispata TaxID=231223 RepID=A0AAE1AUS2_9GAST|nr:hypothetical protein RRG08_060953 [Elysia crispata]
MSALIYPYKENGDKRFVQAGAASFTCRARVRVGGEHDACLELTWDRPAGSHERARLGKTNEEEADCAGPHTGYLEEGIQCTLV